MTTECIVQDPCVLSIVATQWDILSNTLSTVQGNVVQFSAAQDSAVQCIAVYSIQELNRQMKCCAVQYNTA